MKGRRFCLDNVRNVTKRDKRIPVLLLMCTALSLTGCGRQAESTAADKDVKIVCTVFPEYDWVKQILGERAADAEITLLMKNGTDLHSYQPAVWDIRKIADADLFLYVGGESDYWVEAALANGTNPDQRILNLMEILEDSTVAEEHVEGMQGEREDTHSEEDEGAETEYDEHVWLSLRNAQTVCQAITEELCALDEEYGSIYRENNRIYCEELHELDLEYEQAVGQTREPVLLFGDRFPFRYLTEDYGIAYYAAFPGCSAETEAGFSTISFLAEKAGELDLPVILSIDGSDQKIARTIADNTRTRDQKVRMLDSMQSVSSEELENGVSYLSIMEDNLEVLKEALAIRR